MQTPRCPKCKSDKNMTQLLYSWVCEVCDPPKGSMPMPSPEPGLKIEPGKRSRGDETTEPMLFVGGYQVQADNSTTIAGMIAEELAKWDTETQPYPDSARVDCGISHNVDDELNECMVCHKPTGDFSDRENDNSRWYSKLSGCWVLLLVLLFGCSCGGMPDRDIPLMADQLDKSTDLFVKTAGWKLGVDFSDVVINWAEPQECPENQHIKGLVYNNRCYWGLTFSCDEIYVLARPGVSFIETALMHELGHCYQRKTTGGDDALHINTELWELVDETNRELGRLGW